MARDSKSGSTTTCKSYKSLTLNTSAPQEEIAAKDITEISESKPESESEHPKVC